MKVKKENSKKIFDLREGYTTPEIEK